jgi:hypothetical protein
MNAICPVFIKVHGWCSRKTPFWKNTDMYLFHSHTFIYDRHNLLMTGLVSSRPTDTPHATIDVCNNFHRMEIPY